MKSVIAGCALALLGAPAAWAACTNPAGVQGEIIYSTTYNVPMFCDGSDWKAMWVAGYAGAAPPAPSAPAGNGYFVLSQSTWNGNLGGILGADAKCLTELTTNTDWKYHTAADAAGQLVAGKVHAFLVPNNLMPLTNYYFARVGDVNAGGGFFTTDSSGFGPGNSISWAAANYFSGGYNYWSARSGVNCSATVFWGSASNGCSSYTWPSCGAWTNAGAGTNGAYGVSSSLNSGRWGGSEAACDQALRLVCYVDP